MHIIDMSVLRTLYYQKQIVSFHHIKSLVFTRNQNPLLHYQTPVFSRVFYSTNNIVRAKYSSSYASESSESKSEGDVGRTVGNLTVDWSIYDPNTGETITHTGVHESEEKELFPSSSGSDSGDDSGRRSSYKKDENQTQIGLFGNGNGKDHGNTTEVNSSKELKNILGFNGIVGNKKRVKGKVSWVCSHCGHSEGQWWGICPACSEGTMTRFSETSESGGSSSKVSGFLVSENAVRSWLPSQSGEAQPVRLTDVKGGVNQPNWRIGLFGVFGNEVARVLGGGLVPGSLVLIGGDPGVGKSTLLLQMAAVISEGRDIGGPAPVLYVSGEESVEQVGNRADRMKIRTNELFLYSSTNIEDILAKVPILSPRALIIDSIQTVYLKGVVGSAGGIQQVKECTSALLRFAKQTNIPVLLAGHVTKSGDIAGPRVLEHIVDTVLYMEGEENSAHCLLRPVKNRFGSTDELGVFEMSQFGLQAVSNPSEMLLGDQNLDSDFLAGTAVAVIMDGSRSFLIEVQALCVSGSKVLTHVNGVRTSRADMIISVLMKQTGLQLQENAIFLNVVSGALLTETAADLAIAAAVCSSFLEFPIPKGVAFIAEIGLAGELRMVSRMEKRVGTVAKLGYKICVVPKSAEKTLSTLQLEQLKIISCKNLKEVINAVFTSNQGQ